jgi:aminobenzoyl-glutamate utilization protein B
MKSFLKIACLLILLAPTAQAADETALRTELLHEIDGMNKQIQVMNDMIFSFAELGFQEFETSRYLIDILEKEGFTVERGIAGVPTAWMATWGSGKPVIALGSDVDCIPQASQKPGVAWHEPLIEGAPGHGEGHNSGQAVNIAAALAVKRIMLREHLSGTIKIWPGIAEEDLGTKAYYVRAGYFKGVDAALFAHVGDNLQVTWGEGLQSGMISVEYLFKGESAHAAGAPWRGRSALDAVELMDVGWNFRREHLRLQQRSHYVITNGGDQPNVVPQTASVWYYFRELDYQHIKDLWQIGDNMAKGATLMTNTEVTERVLGSAWPVHMNKAIAEDMYANIKQVGLPVWDDKDQTLAKAVQHEVKATEEGLAVKLAELQGPRSAEQRMGGGSDDIGDISWTVPTVTLNYPSNIPGLPGHNWSNAISMATPIAHKGNLAGAKVQALTLLDLILKPQLVDQAWTYFRDVQTKTVQYQPLIRPDDKPAIWLNEKTMATYRERMKNFYFNPAKYDNYLEQLGITYPTVKRVQ